MNKEKFYGCYQMTYDSYKCDSKTARLWEIFYGNVLENGGDMYAISNGRYCISHSNRAFEDKKDALNFVAELRWEDKESRRNERYGYHHYKRVFFVHECDEDGLFVASKAEVKKALAWAFAEGRIDDNAANIKPEYRDLALKILNEKEVA